VTYQVVIPGEPVPQGRPRFRVVDGRPRVYDPARARTWKEGAAWLMRTARNDRRPFELWFPGGPVEARVTLVFPCPQRDRRVRVPAERRAHDTWPDADNLAKAVMDAATKARVWRDDGQVARLVVDKIVAAQNEEPYVELAVAPLLNPTEPARAHTALPWRVWLSTVDGSINVSNAAGEFVCTVSRVTTETTPAERDRALADARLIVDAVNRGAEAWK
jgi:Holliday junction resolvase RusA-like endonuclease